MTYPTLALAAALFTPLLAHATNGYFSHGYGAASEGSAGVGIALAQDSLAAASNPAGTAAVGNRVDLGLDVFAPRRGADIKGNAFGADASYSGNASETFFVPSFGYTRSLNASTAIGLAVYGNCGMNTDYASNPYARFGATGTAGVNLEQLFITPSLAYKLGDSHTLGVAVNLAYQRFSAKGVGLFAGFSSAPTHVSDQGTDSTTGAGVRLGWTGKLTPSVTLGATWASKISGRFDKYKGLFSDGGGFDVPENYGLGLALQATPDLTLAADWQTIRYSQVGSVGNSVASLFAGRALGVAQGPGFGWKDSSVLKIAAVQKVSAALTLRAGLSFANQVVPAGETFFNILAPGVVKNHLTLGSTWTAKSGGEWTGFYAHGFGETVNGVNSIPPGLPSAGGFGGGNANVRLKENIVGLSYAWKL
jgi:long-chain fatty acid transport protein